MKKNPNFIIHVFIILSIIFFAANENIFCGKFIVLAGESQAVPDELSSRLNTNNKISCDKTKRKIQAAIELYIVENGVKNTAEISMDDLLKSGILKFEPACPEGGKYKISKGNAGCLKCDKPAPSKVILPPLPGRGNNQANAEGTGETAVSDKKKIITSATLEASISKYINKEDTFILDKTEKPVEKKTDEAEVKKSGEINDPAQAEAPNIKDDETKKAQKNNKTDEVKEPVPEQIQPETPVIGKSAKDFHREAIEHARKGEIDKALEKFQKAIELVPDSFTYHYNYGLFLAKIESFDLAYIEFQRATRLKPDDQKVKNMIEKLKKAISLR